jgi:hypothetical protein
MKLKLLLYISLILAFTYLMCSHLKCTNFNGNFHYSSVVNSFHLNELISTETGVPIFVARVFHNKITIFSFDLFNRYLQFFDIGYLIKILGLVGVFGLAYFYFSIFSKKNKNLFINMFGAATFLLPFMEIFQLFKLIFSFKLLIFILPYQVASIIGYVFFIKQKGKIAYAIYFMLLILSISWIIVFQNESLSFCTQLTKAN